MNINVVTVGILGAIVVTILLLQHHRFVRRGNRYSDARINLRLSSSTLHLDMNSIPVYENNVRASTGLGKDFDVFMHILPSNATVRP